MSDSFFGFDPTLEPDALEEALMSDEEDEDYDALNDETFGEDVLTGDWEENHEKLVELTELSRHGVNHENGDLSSQLAAFLLDDEPPSNSTESWGNIKPKSRPPPGFQVNDEQPGLKSAISSLSDLCTVEEIERNLIKPLPNSLRLEDLERNLIPQKLNPPGLNFQSSHSFSVHHPRQPLLGTPLQKIPPFPQFHLHPRPPLVPQAFLGVRSGLGGLPPPTPSLFLRVPYNVGPGRGFLCPRGPPEDEYAGLMTSREKQWLASIQLMQLSTSTPFQDDYYYIMYQQRQLGHHGRKLGCPLKALRDSQTGNKTAYTPLQFENSLGKLQVGSVTAPRKIIDTDIVESVECTSSSSSSKKVKQILLEIEHMFSDLLLAEEVLSPFPSSDDIDADKLFLKVVNILMKNDKLKTILGVRKGKTLVLRVLSHPNVSSCLIHRLITILPTVARKDTEQAMLRALPAVRHYLSSASLETLVELSEQLQSDISFLLSNKFGISVITNMIERAEMLMSQSNTENPSWTSFLCKILLVCSSLEIERPVVGISAPVLHRHLSRCTSANNQHIATLQKALSTLSSVEKS